MDKWTAFKCSACNCEFEQHKWDDDLTCPHCGSDKVVEQPTLEQAAGVA